MIERNCYNCKFFAELKQPHERTDGAVIYGYCFKYGDKNYNMNEGKGLAVFLPEGECKAHRRRTVPHDKP